MDSATPIAARRISIQGSPDLLMRVRNAKAATKQPATGVHNPTKRSAPAIIAAISRIASSTGCAALHPRRPQATTAPPATSRRIRRPAPGQPRANVEKRRRRSAPYSSLPNCDSATKPQQGLSATLSGPTWTRATSSSLDNPALNTDHRSMGPVVRTELGKDILYAPFDGVFCNRKLRGNLLVRASGGDQPQHINFSLR
jgi:hypothetical protein